MVGFDRQHPDGGVGHGELTANRFGGTARGVEEIHGADVVEVKAVFEIVGLLRLFRDVGLFDRFFGVRVGLLVFCRGGGFGRFGFCFAFVGKLLQVGAHRPAVFAALPDQGVSQPVCHVHFHPERADRGQRGNDGAIGFAFF